MKIDYSIIRFPDISLQERDGHKLRGFFGTFFQEESPLIHNHFEGGYLRYGYPLVQYKVLDSVPHLIGLGEGAHLLNDLFLRIHDLILGETYYPVYEKNITFRSFEIGVSDTLHHYRFATLWMALNQDNAKRYAALATEKEKQSLLVKILNGNFLSLFKTLGYTAQERILSQVVTFEKTTLFKGNNMFAFDGHFISNVVLPDYIGIGKSVSRGYGTIKLFPFGRIE